MSNSIKSMFTFDLLTYHDRENAPGWSAVVSKLLPRISVPRMPSRGGYRIWEESSSESLGRKSRGKAPLASLWDEGPEAADLLQIILQLDAWQSPAWVCPARSLAIANEGLGICINYIDAICKSTIVVLMCENIFTERIIRGWNILPPSIVSFESLLSFRNSLCNVNLGIHTKYWSLFFSFLLSLYLVFKLRLILCVLLLYACLCWLCGM